MRLRSVYIIYGNVYALTHYYRLRVHAQNTCHFEALYLDSRMSYSVIIGLFQYNVPSGTHKQAVIHQQIKTKNDLVPQRAAVQQELS